MIVYTGIIYIRLQQVKCKQKVVCACDYTGNEVSGLLKMP
jgi:hypothetical protein